MLILKLLSFVFLQAKKRLVNSQWYFDIRIDFVYKDGRRTNRTFPSEKKLRNAVQKYSSAWIFVLLLSSVCLTDNFSLLEKQF